MRLQSLNSLVVLSAFLCLCGSTLVLAAEPQAYPKSDLIVEPAALAKPDAAAKFVILDVRSEKSYAEGHVPDAVRAGADMLSKAFNTDADADSWAKRLGQLGIGAEMPVVVYGDDWREAARVWWILRYWGVKDARLLNGGWTAWKADGGKVSQEAASPKPVAGIAGKTAERLATKEQVLGALQDKSAQIWDARSADEFAGAAGGAKRKGCIPGAAHLEWSDLVDARSQKLKPAADLAKLLTQAGIDPTKPVVTYCQSGGRASVAAFVVELMGGEKVKNYYRSWAEWGNAEDTPVAKPGKK